MSGSHSPDKERMELRHDPVPGYRPVLWVMLAVAVAYLIFLFTSSHGAHHKPAEPDSTHGQRSAEPPSHGSAAHLMSAGQAS